MKYLEALKNRVRNTVRTTDGYAHKVSHDTMDKVIGAVADWYRTQSEQYHTGDLNRLIKRCKNNPHELKSFRDKLQGFSDLEPLPTHRGHASYIKGISHKNGLLLTGVNVDNHFNGTPEVLR